MVNAAAPTFCDRPGIDANLEERRSGNVPEPDRCAVFRVFARDALESALGASDWAYVIFRIFVGVRPTRAVGERSNPGSLVQV